MSGFINTELKSDSESSGSNSDSEKIEVKVGNELMKKLEKCGSDFEEDILLTLGSKTSSDGTCLGEPPGGFCDVGCHFVLLFISFLGYFTMPPALHPSFSGP